MIQKIFEAAVNGEITEFTELLTKELNARIHAAIDERVSDTIDATYNVCEECDWDEDDDTWTDEDVDEAYFDENEDDIYDGEDISEMNYLGKDKKFGREFYEKDGQLHVKKPGGTYVQNLGSVSVPSNKKIMKGLVKEFTELDELKMPKRDASGRIKSDKVRAAYRKGAEKSFTKAMSHDKTANVKISRGADALNKAIANDDRKGVDAASRDIKSAEKHHAKSARAFKRMNKRDRQAESVELEEAKKKKKAKKDYDGDGKIETSTAEWQGSRDKAIKAAIAARGGN